MRLQTLEFSVKWPNNLPISDLREYLINLINKEGEPLRWAITNVKHTRNTKEGCELDIEAVVIII
ncbi:MULTISPECIES: hypothetical protein [Prochlorococcus]|uniref:hypothetical protein n=1 Tax=Prochlorococcus TaxID=1218 RepID=UPI000533BCD9|nr:MULTISPECIES: hypothetical protein [Prochlorococcus]KGG13476.1 hypothetical protein EV05_0130 [Prochlorococcus sp. MIT 0601]